ncbi:class I SAM-dependent methyltransferase [Arthrobacter zhaoguopingii]|uniref:class I SAM-dependent methyltransferase n=1 Tax=Arthrobacter zhaoguopingii TaxID=2681491 RepID=UPI001FE314A9|nr:class I SAM-dependent methyltransferase [Arthrobacter zhaoguopingii]
MTKGDSAAVRLLNRARLVPRIAWLAARAPRDPHRAWEGYWKDIRTTGAGGQVLWDSASDAEREQYADALRAHLDTSLPVIDVGCGNGSFTRWLAGIFPEALGVDVSPSAIARAEAEAAGLTNVSFAVVDATEPGAAVSPHRGACNVFVRGVLHVLPPRSQAVMAANLRTSVRGGRVFLTETNFPGSSLEYVERLGAAPGYIPAGLKRAIAGLPRPGHFGATERGAAFPEDQWTLLADGPAVIHAVPSETAESTPIPGYFAVLQPRKEA